MIDEPDFINVLGILGVGEESNFSIVLVILPDFLFPDPDEPVVVDNVVSYVILNSGIDSFCISGSILCSISCQACHLILCFRLVLVSSEKMPRCLMMLNSHHLISIFCETPCICSNCTLLQGYNKV